MKLLLILPSLNISGPINVALNILKHLDGFSVDLLVLKNGDLYDEFNKYCDNIYIKNIPESIMFLLKNNNNYPIYHSHCVIPDLLVTLFLNKNKVKKISTLHNYIDIDYISEKGFLYGKVISFLHKFSLKRMNKVVACSKSVSNYIETEYGIKSCYIRNGVSLGGEIKNSFKSIETYIIIGVFNKRKNHTVAIDGFIKANKKNSQLLVLGNGPLFSEIVSKYTNVSNVKFLGNVSNVREYLSKSDVYLSSSLAEGLPMSLLESLSEGLTYIISDIAPHKEIFEMDRSAGIIVSNNVTEFSKAVNFMNKNKIDKMSKRTKNLFLGELTEEIMSKKYEDLFNEIIIRKE
ncbi:TPA: glycosyltransferase family 4 protein [Photobacterium damselae]